MKTLSITFHCTSPQLENWNLFLNDFLLNSIENLPNVKHYIFSEVHTEMIEEGENFNLFLIFENEDNRTYFIENQVQTITEMVETEFGNEVMAFLTFLNPIQYRLCE